NGGETLRVVVNPHNHGGVTWVFENVTEKLELQSNYNALIRTQGETLDNLREAVAVFGLDGRMRLCNPVFAQMWNLDRGEAMAGRHIGDICEHCRVQLRVPAIWDEIGEA